MIRIPIPIKRKLIQIVAFGITNSHVANFATGRIYTGKWKNFCSPGLNCYSCPAATLACPIGALQAVNGSMDFSFSFYVVGFLMAVGVLFGRAICGFACPFGLFQEILYKIPSRKWKLPAWMKYTKYGILLVFVFIMPIFVTNYMGIGAPAFCKYICPAGMVEGAFPLLLAHSSLRSVIGPIFSLKFIVLMAVIVGSVLFHRFFCKLLCPLGAIYALFNRFSFFRLTIERNLCINCGRCAKVCGMDVDPVRNCDSMECIRCGDCVNVCPTKALSLGFNTGKKKIQTCKECAAAACEK